MHGAPLADPAGLAWPALIGVAHLAPQPAPTGEPPLVSRLVPPIDEMEPTTPNASVSAPSFDPTSASGSASPDSPATSTPSRSSSRSTSAGSSPPVTPSPPPPPVLTGPVTR
jgi:hypothetical protein